MKIPLTIVNSKHTDRPDAVLKPVDVALFVKHYDGDTGFQTGSIFEIALFDFMPPATFEVIKLLPYFPDQISNQSFALKTDDVNWFDIREWAPSEAARKKLLKRIENLLIEALQKVPEPQE